MVKAVTGIVDFAHLFHVGGIVDAVLSMVHDGTDSVLLVSAALCGRWLGLTWRFVKFSFNIRKASKHDRAPGKLYLHVVFMPKTKSSDVRWS